MILRTKKNILKKKRGGFVFQSKNLRTFSARRSTKGLTLMPKKKNDFDSKN